MIYLDNAATTQTKPLPVKKAVLTALERYSANPGRSGHTLSQNAALAIYSARRNVASFFGSKPENVIFTSNCTQALNYVIKGVLRRGDHAIISSFEHNAVARPMHKLQQQGIITYDVAPIIPGNCEAATRAFEGLIRPETRLVVCTHASNVTGEILPIEKIAKICKDRNILFAVDAAQSAGVLNIDMNCGIDFLCVAPHKGLYAPMGTGILIANAHIDNTLIEGGTGSYSNSLEQPDDMPERLESGTINVPGIVGLSAGVDFIRNIGVERIYAHELKLMQQFYDGACKIKGLKLYSERPEAGENVPLVSFNVAGKTSMETAAILSDNGIYVRAGLHCAPLAHTTLGTMETGTVRVCPSVFTTEREISALLRILTTKIVEKLT